jgi:periplasmic copper chaperone A
MRLSAKALVLAVAAATLPAVALPASAQVQATGAWARGTVGGQTSTAVYMRLRSAQPAAVIAVDSPLGLAELHQMNMDGDIMRMRSLKRLELPAGRTVELDPAGAHIMLTGLKRPLAKGDRVPLRLTIETGGKTRRIVDVAAEVRDPTATGGAR